MIDRMLPIRETTLDAVARILQEINNNSLMEDPRIKRIAQELIMDLSPTEALRFAQIYDPKQETWPCQNDGAPGAESSSTKQN